MNWKYQQILDLLAQGKNVKLLKNSKHGLERECLRITPDGRLAQTPHPHKLGSALAHPYVTTDFSESQLELITPACSSEDSALNFLKDIHLFIDQNLSDEILWPFSMPCILPAEKNIPLAQYGRSRQAEIKTKYREGLSHRYGRKMQTVSGTHYNFSFSEEFWDFIRKKFAPKEDLNTFISESYLGLIRNFLRYGWLNTYLFGAAPAVDKSYLVCKNKALKRFRLRTCYGPYATSLRMSSIGYYSKGQSQLAISFNDLKSYQKDLKYAISTPSPKYKNAPGLNDHILQIPNEHYSRIRPKNIQNGRINYVEARSVDINPYSPTGISQDQLYFLHIFLTFCLFKESPKLLPAEIKEMTTNQNTVAIFGRKPDLQLVTKGKKVSMVSWAEKLLNEMRIVAQLLDQALSTKRYSRSFNLQIDKIHDPELTPSAKIMHDLRNGHMSFAKFGLQLAQTHHKQFRQTNLNPKKEESLAKTAKQSHIDQENLEIRGDYILYGYEDMEYSTQFILREAWRRGVQVEILDRADNFLRLRKGRKVQYLKQSTKTSLDSYVSSEIMGNKFVSKLVMGEHGIKVPAGALYDSIEDALDGYGKFELIKVAVKPVSTNYGTGISFVKPRDKKGYENALVEAFSHCKSVIVEEFIEGEEYRLLVIDDKVISIVQRIPANVEGDGEHTIKELIKIKNEDPRNHKYEKYYARLGKVELDHLKKQKLTPNAILKKGQIVFLRTNSNVSTGGDPIAVTDKIPQKFKDIAVRAAQSVNVKICGVDMLIKGDNYAIIEINYNPALQMHEFPYRGPSCRAAAAVFDLLGF